MTAKVVASALTRNAGALAKKLYVHADEGGRARGVRVGWKLQGQKKTRACFWLSAVDLCCLTVEKEGTLINKTMNTYMDDTVGNRSQKKSKRIKIAFI